MYILYLFLQRSAGWCFGFGVRILFWDGEVQEDGDPLALLILE